MEDDLRRRQREKVRVLDCRLTPQLVCADFEENVLIEGWGGVGGVQRLLHQTQRAVTSEAREEEARMMEDTEGLSPHCQASNDYND